MSNMKPLDKYMLLFRSTDWYEGLPEAKVREIVSDWMAWYQRLADEGIVESGSPLGPERKIVGKDGQVSDGPFAEATETIGGFFMLNVKSFDEATAIAKGCPALPYGIRVEVRQLLEACPFADGAPESGKLATASA